MFDYLVLKLQRKNLFNPSLLCMKLIITLQSKIIVSVFAKNTTNNEKTAFGAFTLSFMHTKRSLVWRKSTLSNEAIEGVYISPPHALL